MHCPHCNAYLEDAPELAGQMVACPKCGGQFGMAGPFDVPSSIDLPLSESDPLTGHLTTTSGAKISFTAVLLFDLRAIQRFEALRSAAQANLRGFSSGLGFVGSLGGVITRALALGLVESAVSSAMHKQGQNQLEELYNSLTAVRQSGRFIALNKIQNIRVPDPKVWRCFDYDRKRNLRQGFIFNEDPAVALMTTEGKSTTIFWDKVEQYMVNEGASTYEP